MKKKGFPLLLIVFLLFNGCASNQDKDEDFIDYSGFFEGALHSAADVQEATVSMNFPIVDIPESGEDDVHYIFYLEDKNVEENPVFHAFIQNEITAYDQTEDQNLYMTDFFLKLHPNYRGWWCGIHYMAEDLDGDGDEELLVYLGCGVQVADLYVFDEIDGKLYAWEIWKNFYTWRMSNVEYCGNGVFHEGGSDGVVFVHYNFEGKIEYIMEFYPDWGREGGTFRLYEDGFLVKELSYEGDYFNEEGLTPDDREIVDEINVIMEEIRNKYGRGKQICEVSAYDEAEQIPLEDLLSMWQTNSSK